MPALGRRAALTGGLPAGEEMAAFRNHRPDMSPTLSALAPVFLVILAGWGLKGLSVVPDAAWAGIEALVYRAFFPCLLFHNLATAGFAGLEVGAMAASLLAAVLAAAALLWPARRLTGLTPAAWSSVIQGAIRPNTYVALAAVVGLFGRDGAVLLAVAIAATVPVVNVISVLALARLGGGRVNIARALATNPLILACAAGVAVNLAGLLPPPLIMQTIDLMGRATLPLGLVCVGAGLVFAELGLHWRGLALSSLAKLALLPALTFGFGRLFGLDGPAFAVAVTFNAMPVAASAYVLARQMGGDHRLMAAIVTVQVVLAGFSLPIVLSLLA